MTNKILRASSPRRTVKVTREHIDNSKQANSSHCMIAEAVKEAIPDARFVSVDLATIRFSKDGLRFTYLTPASAQLNLLKFDQGDPTLEPFSFRISGAQVTERGRAASVAKPQLKPNSQDGKKANLVKVGGKPPRQGPLSSDRKHTGARRQFGLKTMGRLGVTKN